MFIVYLSYIYSMFIVYLGKGAVGVVVLGYGVGMSGCGDCF